MAGGTGIDSMFSSMQPDQCIEEKVVAVISLLFFERIKYLVSSLMNLSVHFRWSHQHDPWMNKLFLMDEIYERRSLPNPTYTQSIHTYRHAYIYIHYITFHYTALRYITSQYITVHCSTLHRILDTFILTYCIEIWFTFTWTACAFQHCIVQRYWCNSLSHVICI